MNTPSPKRRPAARKSATTSGAANQAEPQADLQAATPTDSKAGTRARAKPRAKAPAPAVVAQAPAPAAVKSSKTTQAAAAAKPARKRAAAPVAEAPSARPTVEEVPAKPPRRARTTQAAAPADAVETPVAVVAAQTPAAPEEAPARARRRKPKSEASKPAVADTEPTADAVSETVTPEAAAPVVPASEAVVADADATPAKARRGRSRRAAAAVDETAPGAETTVQAPASVEPPEPAEPPRYVLGPREDEGVFGDYELRDQLTGATLQLRLLGESSWRCDCEDWRRDGECAHGPALQALLSDEARQTLRAGWPAAEAELWLRPGAEHRLQWVAGQGWPLSDGLPGEAAQGVSAEQALGWVQAQLSQARELGLVLRVDPGAWAQLALVRDQQARVQRLEQWMTQPADPTQGQGEPPAPLALLKDELPVYQWEAALFALSAGRALLADDLGLGQRGAALLAMRLWAVLFGVETACVVAPRERHAAWLRDADRWLGEVPKSLRLVEPGATALGEPGLLIVDALQALPDDVLVQLRAQPCEALLLLADQEPLGDVRLSAWVDWLDPARRGPLARLQALGEEGGEPPSKKSQREALQTVLLSRRRRELAEQLPPQLGQPLWLEPAGQAAPATPLRQLRGLAQRWRSLRYLNSMEQQQLLEALALLQPASRQVLAAKAEALLALRADWLQGVQPVAPRLLVCARSETLLDSLSQSPQIRRLGVQRLHAAATPEQRDAQLQAWRQAPAGLLLASDAALRALPSQALVEARAALVHADLPWSAELALRRAQTAAGPAPQGLAVAWLLVRASLDEALHAAQRAGQVFPAWLDAVPAWLDEAQLAELMARLEPVLDAL